MLLYLRKLLSQMVIREIAMRLVFLAAQGGAVFEDRIECFCVLLRNCGAKLDADHFGKGYMQQFANRLKDLIRSGSYSKRITYMMKDVLDTRANGWRERQYPSRALVMQLAKIDRQIDAGPFINVILKNENEKVDFKQM